MQRVDLNIGTAGANNVFDPRLPTIFQSTKHVLWMFVGRFSEHQTLENLEKVIKRGLIGGICFYDDWYLVNTLIRLKKNYSSDTAKKMISRLQIDVFQMRSRNYLCKDTWGRYMYFFVCVSYFTARQMFVWFSGEFIHCIADFVPIMVIEFRYQ